MAPRPSPGEGLPPAPPSAVPKAVPEARRASATAGTPRTQETGVAQARRLQAALRGRGAPPGGKGEESGRCAVLRYKMRRGLLRRAKGFGGFFFFCLGFALPPPPAFSPLPLAPPASLGRPTGENSQPPTLPKKTKGEAGKATAVAETRRWFRALQPPPPAAGTGGNVPAGVALK